MYLQHTEASQPVVAAQVYWESELEKRNQPVRIER